MVDIYRHLFDLFLLNSVIVKASSGPRYVVGCRSKVDKEKLTSGTRVVLDMTTLTIMRALPREVSHCGVSEHVFMPEFIVS
jgi:ATP-dependent 26S proteasome regulatory subunit